MTTKNSNAGIGTEAEIIAKQVAEWSRERDRLQDLINHATGSVGTEAGIDLDSIERFWKSAKEDRQLPCTDPDQILALIALARRAAPDSAQAARDVLAERRRQVEKEGFTPERDDKYQGEELRWAAAAYTLGMDPKSAPAFWTWPLKWWKPRDRRSNLVKAGALILAEIERIDRTAPSATSAAAQAATQGDKS
jgi:hypothetical protein